MAIIDSITTIAEVCGLQNHNMNSLANLAATHIFSDANIEYAINNVIRFVYGNSKEDINTHLQLWAINTLSVYELNNIMLNAGYLPEWTLYDTFNKEAFNEMIKENKSDDDGPIDVIFTMRGQFNGVEDPW